MEEESKEACFVTVLQCATNLDIVLRFFFPPLNRLKRRYVAGLMKRFPNVDREYLKELYPDIDIQRLEDQGRTAGHYLPK